MMLCYIDLYHLPVQSYTEEAALLSILLFDMKLKQQHIHFL